MKSIRFEMMVLGLVLAAGYAHAQTATNNLNIVADVQPSCQIDNVSDVDFGTYNPLSATPTDAEGSVTFRCVKGTGFKAFIVGIREMTGGGDTIAFELYSDPGRTTVFDGDNSDTSEMSAGINPVVRGIYGRIAPGQDVSAASYSATLVVTVEY